MKGSLLSENINNNEWILNSKFKIKFDIINMQIFKDLKGYMNFYNHFFVIKINENHKKSFYEILKNLFFPIYYDEENNIFINYSLLDIFRSYEGTLHINVNNPINKKNIFINITCIEKNKILFNSSLKSDEIIRITKFINMTINLETKHLMEEFLRMINNFEDILDMFKGKNISLDKKIIKAIDETKIFYEKNIKELKKKNQFKNKINKKILKDNINSKQVDKKSICILSQIENVDFASFELILPDLKNRGFKLIEENIFLFFEVTYIENNYLNLKEINGSKVSDNLKNIQINNLNFEDSNYKTCKNFNTIIIDKNYLSQNNFENIKFQKKELILSSYYTSNNRIENKNKLTSNHNKNKIFSNIDKIFDNSTRSTKKIKHSYSTDFQKKYSLSKEKISTKNLTNIDKYQINNQKNKATVSKLKLYLENKEYYSKDLKINENYIGNQKIIENNTSNINIARYISDTITDINSLNEDNNHQNITNQNNIEVYLKDMKNQNSLNNNYDINFKPFTNNLEILLSNNKNFDENYFVEKKENISSSTKTNPKKEAFEEYKINNEINYIENLKNLKENDYFESSLDTPKFYGSKDSNINKNMEKKEKNHFNFSLISKKINIIKEKHLFAINNNYNNIFFNSVEFFCRKYFDFCFEKHFPKLFILERDLNGIFKIESFYSYLFYLRALKNYLFTDNNRIKFTNMVFFK